MKLLSLFGSSLLGAMLATALNVEGTLLHALLAALLLVLIYLGFPYLWCKRTDRQVLLQKPKIIVSKGQINETELRQIRMAVPELIGELRVKGYSSLADVEFAIMESGGNLSVIPKSKQK